jgi:hypothetical protein
LEDGTAATAGGEKSEREREVDEGRYEVICRRIVVKRDSGNNRDILEVK